MRMELFMGGKSMLLQLTSKTRARMKLILLLLLVACIQASAKNHLDKTAGEQHSVIHSSFKIPPITVHGKVSSEKGEVDTIGTPVWFSMGRGSDDIADISWNVPTVVLRFPSNIHGAYRAIIGQMPSLWLHLSPIKV